MNKFKCTLLTSSKITNSIILHNCRHCDLIALNRHPYVHFLLLYITIMLKFDGWNKIKAIKRGRFIILDPLSIFSTNCTFEYWYENSTYSNFSFHNQINSKPLLILKQTVINLSMTTVIYINFNIIITDEQPESIAVLSPIHWTPSLTTK